MPKTAKQEQGCVSKTLSACCAALAHRKNGRPYKAVVNGTTYWVGARSPKDAAFILVQELGTIETVTQRDQLEAMREALSGQSKLRFPDESTAKAKS